MFKPKMLIVPTDFSTCSSYALKQAVELSLQFGSKIRLVHVIQNDPDMLPLFHMDGVLIDSVRDKLIERAEQDLEEFSREHGGDLFPSIERTIRFGVAYDEIIKEGVEYAADLIIISSRGKSALEGLIFGSTTEKVIRYAQCSVLLVRGVLQNTPCL